MSDLNFHSYSVIMQLFVFFHTLCQVLNRWKSTCDIIPLDFKRGNQGQQLEAFVNRKEII